MEAASLFNAGRVPAERMLNRPDQYVLIHFSPATFADKEWGYGDESPASFNPDDFDADAIARTVKDAGFGGIILVCKHHDGFCLWPTKTTAHNISASPWRGGRGDMVGEFADAAHKYGLGMGFYVSPWDRNNPHYGTPEYVQIFRTQLRELLTWYGPAFEVWFDGANGGDGYYGGKRETRTIPRGSYYGWEETWKIVRELQPGAAIFSDVGPDLRWVGNELGYADPGCFGSMTSGSDPSAPGSAPAPGYCDTRFSNTGFADGKLYLPPECDVPLRPGWFYHARENDQLRSVRELVRIYLNSVGSGGFLNLGLSPDLHGRLHPNDDKRLHEYGAAIRSLFADRVFFAEITSGTAKVTLPVPKTVDLIELREDLTDGEKVVKFTVELLRNGRTVGRASGKSVSRRRLRIIAPAEADTCCVTAETIDGKPVNLTVAGFNAPYDLLQGELEKRDLLARPDYRKCPNGTVIHDGMTLEAPCSGTIKGFVFTPNAVIQGLPDRYTFEGLLPDGSWQVLAHGEFANIAANPLPQIVEFSPVECIRVRFRADRLAAEFPALRYRELGVLTAPEEGKPKQWRAQWIGIPGACLSDIRWPSLPAPEFRQIFVPDHTVAEPEVFICGLGFFEWTVNGKKVTGDRLVPSPTQYDKRWRYLRYKLDFPLEAGKPYIFSVVLGNGLYNAQTHEVWNFDKADWRDYPKMIFQLEEKGNVLLVSDRHWITAFTGTRFDSMRGGENYDARLEKDFSMALPEASVVPRSNNDYHNRAADELWHYAWVTAPPGGIGVEQTFPGCRAIVRNEMQEVAPGLWKAPVNAAGWPVLRVQGEAGASVRMICGEQLSADGKHVDTRKLSFLLLDGPFQEDTYILKGGEPEAWHPRFTWHGFQYVETVCEGPVRILSLHQQVLHTGFARHGSIRTSDSRLMRLEEAAMRANVSNFCGFPTDCPQREKNGWTSESMLMCETLLYGYDAAAAYAGYAETILDTQRLSGQLSGIAPCAGWGYNWGSGGHWDLALIDIPWSLRLFTGKADSLRTVYSGMKKCLEFLAVTAEDGISHGLGDWLAPEGVVEDPVGACATACRIAAVTRTIQAAKVLGETQDIPALESSLAELKAVYNRTFYCGNGIYRGKHSTFSAMPLNFNIVPQKDRARCAAHLAETVRARQWKVDYGTIGSRQVPRALFENGYADDAFKLMTQEEYPGYQYMVNRSSTLTEDWQPEKDSMNHGAFSDIAGCMYRYLAGFRHSEEHPGRDHLEIVPAVPAGLDDFAAEYIGFRSGWKREKDGIVFEFTVPAGATAHIRLPDGTETDRGPGNWHFRQ